VVRDGRTVVVKSLHQTHGDQLLQGVGRLLGYPDWGEPRQFTRVQVLDVGSGREVAKLEREGFGIDLIQVSPDGKSLAISASDRSRDSENVLELWDIPPRKPWGLLVGLWTLLAFAFVLWKGWRACRKAPCTQQRTFRLRARKSDYAGGCSLGISASSWTCTSSNSCPSTGWPGVART
jgi:hypothetical protein